MVFESVEFARITSVSPVENQLRKDP